jgi:hypothetical protein
MKTVTIEVTWVSYSTLEVEDDWEIPEYWSDFTDEEMEEIDRDAAREISPSDWELL